MFTPVVAAIALEMDAHNVRLLFRLAAGTIALASMYPVSCSGHSAANTSHHASAPRTSQQVFRASVLVVVSRQDYLHGVIPEGAAVSLSLTVTSRKIASSRRDAGPERRTRKNKE
jgi:hypothetical protein